MLRCSFRMIVVLGLACGVFSAVAEAKDYYVSNKPEAGQGTKADPFGLPDLQSPDPEKVGKACAVLQPGDTLWFKGGRYEFSKTAKPGNWYYAAHLRPERSGEPGKPISLRAMPGERVVLERVGGGQPIFGSLGPGEVRFEGFVMESRAQGQGKMIWLSGGCKNVEVAHCEIIGNFDNFDTPNNPAVIFCDRTEGTWIHHNIIRGKTKEPKVSAFGVEFYRTENAVVEDNWIYHLRYALYDKDSGIKNTYRRNLLTENYSHAFYGNNQAKFMQARIYDNVMDTGIYLGIIGDGTEIHDNLLLKGGIGAGGNVWNTKIWNNISLREPLKDWPYYSSRGRDPRNANGERELSEYKVLEYMDYNFYAHEQKYTFRQWEKDQRTLTLKEVREKEGFEKNSRVVKVEEIFEDLKAYKLKPKWAKAGRDGTAPGPEDIALILDTSRYGPEKRRKVSGTCQEPIQKRIEKRLLTPPPFPPCGVAREH